MALLHKYLWPTGIQQWGGYVRMGHDVSEKGYAYSTVPGVLPDDVWTGANPPYPSNPWIGYTRPWYDPLARIFHVLGQARISVSPYTEYRFNPSWWESFMGNTTYGRYRANNPSVDLSSEPYYLLRLNGWVEVETDTGDLYMANSWSDATRPDRGTATSTVTTVAADSANGLKARKRISYTATNSYAAAMILNTVALTTPETGGKDGLLRCRVLDQYGMPSTDPAPALPENIRDAIWLNIDAADRPGEPARTWAAPNYEKPYVFRVTYVEEGLAYWFKLTSDETITLRGSMSPLANTDEAGGRSNMADHSAQGLRTGYIYAAKDVAQGQKVYGFTPTTTNWQSYKPADDPRTKTWGRLATVNLYNSSGSQLGIRAGYRTTVAFKRPADSYIFSQRSRDYRKYLEGDFDFLTGNCTVAFEFGSSPVGYDDKGSGTAAAATPGITLMASTNGALRIKLIQDPGISSDLNNRIQIVYNGVEITKNSITPTPPVKWEMTPGTFFHLAFVKSGNGWRLFKDGVEIDQGTLPSTPPATLFNGTEMILGGNHTNDPEEGLAFIRNVKFYRLAKYSSNFTKPSFPDWQ